MDIRCLRRKSLVFLEGDTIIGEHKYKKLWMLKGEERTYQTALREEERVVYAQHPGEDKEEVICYFTTLGQEKCEFTIQTSDDNFIHFILSEFYPVQASTGRIHHVYESALTYGSYVGGQMMLSNAMWYEGVGNITNAEVFSLTSRFLTENFVECYLDDTCIFKADDVWNFLWDYSDVSSPRFSTKCSKSYFDLQGRSLSCPPEKGVYIRDGRKVVVK